MVLDEKREIVSSHAHTDFAGVPGSKETPFYPTTDGNWVDAMTLSVWLQTDCVPEGSDDLSGGYVLNASVLQAARMDHSP